MKRIMVVAAVLSPVLAHAEPGPTINWLLSKPVSLFDWGMFKLEGEANRASQIAKEELGIRSLFTTTSYNWEDNRIYINAFNAVRGQNLEPATNEKCEEIWNALINNLILDYNEDRVGRAASVLDSLFSHEGYAETDRDEELGQKMSRIVYVSVTIVGQPGVYCEGRIFEGSPSFRRL